MFEEYWYKSKENRTIKELGTDDTDDVELLVDQISIHFTVPPLFNHFYKQNIH